MDLVNVLAEGKKIYLGQKILLGFGNASKKNSYAPTAGRMFVFEESFYLINSNFDVVNVKNRTNAIVKALDPGDQDKAKQIIKEGKLDLSREDHLVLFFTELNKA